MLSKLLQALVLCRHLSNPHIRLGLSLGPVLLGFHLDHELLSDCDTVSSVQLLQAPKLLEGGLLSSQGCRASGVGRRPDRVVLPGWRKCHRGVTGRDRSCFKRSAGSLRRIWASWKRPAGRFPVCGSAHSGAQPL